MKRKKKRPAHEHLPGMRTMRCPYCKSPVQLRSADGIYRDNPHHEKLFVCAQYPKCDAYVRAHPGTNIPLGSLANKELRFLRRKAHEQFNKLFQLGLMSKNDAYSWLAAILNVPKSQAHIGYLGDYYCQAVIEESKKLLAARGLGHAGHSSQRELPKAAGGELYG